MIYKKSFFSPIFGSDLLKSLEFPKIKKGVFGYVNEVTLRSPTWFPGETTMWSQGRNFQSYPPDLQGGERGLNQPCLCNGASIKNSEKDTVERTSGLVNAW